MTLLRLDQVCRRFARQDVPAVHDLSLDVRDDEVFVLVGPSGCGKSTALRMIAGFETPDRGTIHLSGNALQGPGIHVPAEKRGIGLVFQELALFPHLDVLANVMFGLHHLPRAQARDRAMEVLKWLDMGGYAHRRPHELSGGQQQRAALARSLGPAPRLILLDEPFNSLDASLRLSVRDQMRRVLKDQKMSALLVTHDQEEALSFADRIGVMNRGRLLQVGTPQEVYQRPATAFVACFLGRTNLLEGQCSGARAQTPLGELSLHNPVPGWVTISVRPEHLRPEPPRPGAPAGRVIRRQFKGHDITLQVQIASDLYTVQTDYACPFTEGQEVTLVPTEPAVVVVQDPKE